MTCSRNGSQLRFPLKSTANLDGGLLKLKNDLWHDFVLIATKVCSQIIQIGSKWTQKDNVSENHYPLCCWATIYRLLKILTVYPLLQHIKPNAYGELPMLTTKVTQSSLCRLDCKITSSPAKGLLHSIHSSLPQSHVCTMQGFQSKCPHYSQLQLSIESNHRHSYK